MTKRFATALMIATLPALALPACVPAIIGGGAYAVSEGTSERGFGGTATDIDIQTRINKKWFDYDADMTKRLDMTVNDGRVLITGIGRDQNQKMQASRLAWEVNGVKEVINNVELDTSLTFGDVATDTWITSKLRTFLTFDMKVAGRNYTIDTVNKVVYLMGYARNQQELDRVTEHARTIDGVTKVVSYVRVGTEPVSAE
jgi:osmotically-inducible protein OsmY